MIKLRNIYGLLLSLNILLGVGTAYSQHYNRYLEFYSNQNILSKINAEDKAIHTGFKPIAINTNANIPAFDSSYYFSERDKIFSDKLKSRWIYRKIRSENFVEHRSKNFTLLINPILNLALTKSKDYKDNFFMNTRGIEIKGSIGKKVTYYTSFYENQARFVPYVSNRVSESLVAPGQGSVKILKNGKYDFSRASAYVNIDVAKYFAVQLGHAKHFIGEGYRSLLLADNSFNYPYLKLSASYRNFRYIIMWSQYQSFSTAYYNYHPRKYASMSYLSWMPKAGFEISLFESIIWPGNTKEDSKKFNLNFFNPIIMSRSAIYGLNNEKNILLGLNTRIKIYKYAQFFAQFALDNYNSKEKADNNYAFQIGFKHFDLFHNNIRNANWFVHAEYNYIAPYTYTWQNPSQAFTHYNQAVAHPAGSGLKEIVAISCLNYRDFSLKLKAIYLINSLDENNTNYGSDIFRPNIKDNTIISHIGNKVGQGIENKLFDANVELAYTINPINRLQIFAGFTMRELSNITINTSKQTFYTFGIKTNINNYYYDY